MNPPCSGCWQQGQGESSQAAGAGCLPPPCASRDASSGISKQTQGPRASPELLAGCPCCPTARTACKDSRDTRHRSDFKPPALQCSLAPSPPRWVAQGRAPAQDVTRTWICGGQGHAKRGAQGEAFGLLTRSCTLYPEQVQEPGTCPCSARHRMGPDFHEFPRGTCGPATVNLTQPLQAACATLESPLQDPRLAVRTPWLSCLPGGSGRWGTAPRCHSLHAALWGRHPAEMPLAGQGR